MFEVDHEAPSQTIVPLYIAIAPRDPRETPPTSDDAVDYLEPVSVDEASEALLELGIPAQIIDGADAGSPGWILARTLGTDDGRFLRWAPDENTAYGHYPSIGVEDVAAHLAHELNSACHVSTEPSPPTHSAQESIEGVSVNVRSGAIIGSFGSTDGPLLAATAKTAIWFAHSEGTGIVAGSDPAANLEEIVTWGSLSPIIALERQGHARRITVARWGMVLAVHEFGPLWMDVDPRSIDDYALPDEELDSADLVFDYFEPPQASADDFANHFDLSITQLSILTDILEDDNHDDPFTGILRVLGLPEEAAEVAEGWREPHDLHGADLIEPESMLTAMWHSMTTLPTENTPQARLQRAWITRPPMFYALNTLETGLIAAWTARHARRGNKLRAIAGAALIAVNIADMVTPRSWRDRRYRTPRP